MLSAFLFLLLMQNISGLFGEDLSQVTIIFSVLSISFALFIPNTTLEFNTMLSQIV